MFHWVRVICDAVPPQIVLFSYCDGCRSNVVPHSHIDISQSTPRWIVDFQSLAFSMWTTMFSSQNVCHSRDRCSGFLLEEIELALSLAQNSFFSGILILIVCVVINQNDPRQLNRPVVDHGINKARVRLALTIPFAVRTIMAWLCQCGMRKGLWLTCQKYMYKGWRDNQDIISRYLSTDAST